jgi:uncharacterized OsmC-like protein
MQATQQMINGVDVQKLTETISAIQADGSLAQFQFRASDQWMGCGLSEFKIEPFHGANQEHNRPAAFTFKADEPPVLLGTDKGPNPVEYAIAAMLGCMTNTMAYHAAARGIEIESIESKVDGDIDLHGFLQLNPKVRSGYQEIRVKFRVKTNGDPELLKKLAQKSPVYDTIANPVRVVVDVETV